jgi:hypothetical protein
MVFGSIFASSRKTYRLPLLGQSKPKNIAHQETGKTLHASHLALDI